LVKDQKGSDSPMFGKKLTVVTLSLGLAAGVVAIAGSASLTNTPQNKVAFREAEPGDVKHQPEPGDNRKGKFASSADQLIAREAEPGDVKHQPEPGDNRKGKFASSVDQLIAREAEPGDVKHQPEPGDNRKGKFADRELTLEA
jgi:hypothetical protein